uniref:AAA_12 domain-containing protein n=1 Tax=Panagrellus redivivus TaxID=6233 RepID=A0A7E4VUE0_PANRE
MPDPPLKPPRHRCDVSPDPTVTMATTNPCFCRNTAKSMNPSTTIAVSNQPQSSQTSLRTVCSTATTQQKPFIAEAIKPSFGENRFLIFARQGPPSRDMPALVKVGDFTVINNGEFVFDNVFDKLDAGVIVIVLQYDAADEPIIEKIPAPNMSRALKIEFTDARPRIISCLTMLTDVQFDRQGRMTECRFIDTVSRQERYLRKALMPMLAQNAKTLQVGTLFRAYYVNYGPGSRYIAQRNMYFSPLVVTPMTVKHEVVPEWSDVAAMIGAVYEDCQKTELKLNVSVGYGWIGELMKLSLIAAGCVKNREKREAELLAKPQWKILCNGNVEITVWLRLKVFQMMAVASCYVKGGFIVVRRPEDKIMVSIAPASFMITAIEFDEEDESILLKAVSSMKAVTAAVGTNFMDTIVDKEVLIQPGTNAEMGTTLAEDLINGKLKHLYSSENENVATSIFKAIFGQSISATTTEPDELIILNDKLKHDRTNIISLILGKQFPVIHCEAPAGCGKTTLIAETCREYCKRQSKWIPMLVSTANAPVLHAARELQDMETPPLVLASTVAIAKKVGETVEADEKCTLMSHLQRLMDNVKLAGNDRCDVEEAYSIEVKLRKQQDSEASAADRLDLLPPQHGVDDEMDDDEVNNVHGSLKTNGRSVTKQIAAGIEVLLRLSPPPLIAATTAMAFKYANVLKDHVRLLLIDEACTVPVIHAAALLSKFNTIQKLVLVGDSKQLAVYSRNLPAIVKNMGFESVFSVFYKTANIGFKQSALQTSFRFHPEMTNFVKSIVYPEIDLKSAVTAEARSEFKRLQPLNTTLPIVLLTAAGRDRPVFPISRTNDNHTFKAVEVLKTVIEAASPTTTIAVICLYHAQKTDILQLAGEDINKRVIYASVDSFQGQEADIVLLVTTKTRDTADNGFLLKEERRNVALTRAKSGLVIIGDPMALIQNETWRPVVEKLKEAGTIVNHLYVQE